MGKATGFQRILVEKQQHLQITSPSFMKELNDDDDDDDDVCSRESHRIECIVWGDTT